MNRPERWIVPAAPPPSRFEFARPILACVMSPRMMTLDYRRLAFALLITILVSAVAAAADDAKPADPKITYAEHVLPLLREKCGACHNANDKKGDLIVDNYGALMRGGGSGEVIKQDGDADGSSFYRVIAHLDEPFMPPNQPKLADAQLALVKKWIEQGALENAGSKAKPKKTMVAAVQPGAGAQRPEGPPPLPENYPLEPVVVSPRANGVTALAANPWAPVVAVSSHRQILLYNTSTLDLAGVLPYPEGVPHILKFSRNGQLLLAGGGRASHSGQVVLWDVRTGRRITSIGSEYDVVLGADVSSDLALVALCGPKKMVRVYSTATGELVYETNKHTDWALTLEFSPDAVLLATADRSNGLFVWEAATGREFHNLTGHQGPIIDVAWSPDSNLLASCSEDGTIKLWEMNEGKQTKSWNAHPGGCASVEFTRSGELVSIGRDKVAKHWDLNGGQKRAFAALTEVPGDVAFDNESQRLIAGDLTGELSVFNFADGALIGKVNTNLVPLSARIDQAQGAFVAATAASNEFRKQAAVIQATVKQRADAAEAAKTQHAEAVAAQATALQSKTAADADQAAKLANLTKADEAVKAANEALAVANKASMAVEAERTQAAAALEAQRKVLVEATKAVADAKAAFDEAPNDEAFKAAFQKATEAAAAAEAKVAEFAKTVESISVELEKRMKAVAVASEAVKNAVVAREASAKAKSASDALVKTADAQLQTAVASVAERKAVFDKLAAMAPATADEQKAMQAAEQQAQAEAAKAAGLESKIAALKAAVGRKLAEE